MVASESSASRSAAEIRSSRQDLFVLMMDEEAGNSARAITLIKKIVALCAAGGHDCSPEIRALRLLQDLEPGVAGGGSIPPGVRRLAGNAGLLDAQE